MIERRFVLGGRCLLQDSTAYASGPVKVILGQAAVDADDVQVPGVVEDEAFAAEILVPGFREFRVLGTKHLALMLKPSALPTFRIPYVV